MAANKKNQKINQDGWSNTITNMGILGKDRTRTNKFTSDIRLSRQQLESLYRFDGFAKRIVDLPANEMTREGFIVEGDPENLINSFLEEHNFNTKIFELLKWSRLFGGALAIIGVDDNKEFTEPVDQENIRSIKFMHVFDRWEVSFFDSELYKNPTEANFGTPEIYKITPSESGGVFSVHESRVLRLDGIELPKRVRQMNENWGDSVLQPVYDQLKNLGASYNITANIMEDFIQTILSVTNLQEMVAAGQDEIIKKRLEIIDLSRHVANTIMLDQNESYNKQSSSVSGIDALIDRFALSLAAVTGIPYSFLMGQPPSGLQATGAADIRMFYDMIKASQNSIIKPQLEKLVKYIFLSREGPFKGVQPENWKIQFNALWQLDQLQESQYKKTIAETDAIYLDRGVVDPAEIALSRFGGDQFSPETKIDLQLRAVNREPVIDKLDVLYDHIETPKTEQQQFLEILKKAVE